MMSELNLEKSKAMFDEAQNYLPGGVNSPVRAFRAVGGTPLFIKGAKGSRIRDVDGNEYIDYVGSWGPMILGHAHDSVVNAVKDAAAYGTSFGAPTEAETELAKLVCTMHPACEMIRFVNSGTEATLSAIRLARGATGRDKIIKFAGCYHGHADSFLISAGSGALTLGVPSSPGVPTGTASDTIICTFNSMESVESAFEKYPGEIAGVIVEPVMGNCGCIPPLDGFLEELRDICTREKSILIFDEVMTGFRVAGGGASELYGVTPDIVTLGKVVGGGLPVGAYGGRAELMKQIAPAGPIYQAGTLSGNPLAMAAGFATLKELSKPGTYEELERKSARLSDGIKNVLDEFDLKFTQTRVGSMFSLFCTETYAQDDTISQVCDTTFFNRYFHGLLENGIYIAPSQFEAGFMSLAHTDDDIDTTITAIRTVLKSIAI